jgi:hypothetical protein
MAPAAGTCGMTTVTIPETGIIPASQPPESLTISELVEIAVGTFQRIQDSMPYIIELRKRFKSAPRGKADIGGCDTWEQFCEKHLHRTASAIRKALQAGHPQPGTKLQEPTRTHNELKELADAVPTIRNGKQITPPSEYSAADIVETVVRFTDNLVNQRQVTPSDKRIIYLSMIRQFQDILKEMKS